MLDFALLGAGWVLWLLVGLSVLFFAIAIERLLSRPGPVFHAQGYVLAVVLAVVTIAVIGTVEALRTREASRA